MTTLKDNKNFCVLPWVHIHSWPDGQMMPCCMAHPCKETPAIGNLKTDNVLEVWNNKYYKDIRKKMLADEPVNYCHACQKMEALGFNSTRQHHNKNMLTRDLEQKILNDTHEDGTYERFELIYWDVRFNNICNYKCRMCGSSYSTKWYEDDVVMGYEKIRKEPETSFVDFAAWLEEHKESLMTLQYVYFAGGEPFVQDEHYEFLQFLIDNNLTNVEIYYQSNGSIISHKRRDIFEYWKHFKKVTYSISLDGFGPMGEFIRKGMNSARVDNNITKIHEAGYEVIVNSVSQLTNILYITEFWDELINKTWTDPKKIYFQTLFNPSYMQARHLPEELKKQAIDKILAYKHYELYKEKFDPVLASIREDRDENEFQKFIDETNKLDEHRNENILDWFSELKPYWRNNGKT